MQRNGYLTYARKKVVYNLQNRYCEDLTLSLLTHNMCFLLSWWFHFLPRNVSFGRVFSFTERLTKCHKACVLFKKTVFTRDIAEKSPQWKCLIVIASHSHIMHPQNSQLSLRSQRPLLSASEHNWCFVNIGQSKKKNIFNSNNILLFAY